MIAGFLLTACQPRVIVVEEAGFDVKRDFNNAWATLLDPKTFVQLIDDSWKDIIQNGLVTTDNLGEAQLCPKASIDSSGECLAGETCHIYVFRSSTLQYSSCPESSTSSTCLFDGDAAFINCNVSVGTLSADVQNPASSYAVAYLRESRTTIVILLEGQVTVTPVKSLNYSAIDISGGKPDQAANLPPLVEYQVMLREVGVPERSSIEPKAGEFQVYYTAPDDTLMQLGLMEVPYGPRQWQGSESLLFLRERMRMIEPNLEPWLQDVFKRAQFDGFDVQLAPLSPENAGLVVTGYGILADPRFAEVLAYGVDWSVLTKNDRGYVVPVVINGADPFQGQYNILADAGRMGFEPARANKILIEGGYQGLSLMLMIQEQNDLNLPLELIQNYLREIGIQAEVVVLPKAEMNNFIEKYSNQAMPLLVIEFK